MEEELKRSLEEIKKKLESIERKLRILGLRGLGVTVVEKKEPKKWAGGWRCHQLSQ